jgi:hypothetical protein
MSKHLDAMLAELESLDDPETNAEAARVMAQVHSELALDLSSRMPRIPTHIPRPTIRVPKAETRVPFLSPPPMHRAGIPVLAPAAPKKPKRTAAEVAYEKAVKEAEKLAKAEEKARAKAAKDAEKAYAAYQKEQAKIAKAFEKARADALKVSEKARAEALKVSEKVAAPAKAAKKVAAPTKAVLEGEVMRLRTLLASRGIPY